MLTCLCVEHVYMTLLIIHYSSMRDIMHVIIDRKQVCSFKPKLGDIYLCDTRF